MKWVSGLLGVLAAIFVFAPSAVEVYPLYRHTFVDYILPFIAGALLYYGFSESKRP